VPSRQGPGWSESARTVQVRPTRPGGGSTDMAAEEAITVAVRVHPGASREAVLLLEDG